MTKRPNPIVRPNFLGIECGGTRTVAVLTDTKGQQLNRSEFGPANCRLISDIEMRRHLATVSEWAGSPSAVGIGMAGAREDGDRERILSACKTVWPGIICSVSHDLDTALFAAKQAGSAHAQARILILSGTGSCCYGQSATGKSAKVGGWGHVLGDKGSGYEIGLRAMKAVVHYYDRDGLWPKLGQRILRALQLNVPNDLIRWAQNAEKKSIAALATEVFDAWRAKDPIANDILHGAAHSLAKDAVACARRLAPGNSFVEFVLTGSVLIKQPRFQKLTVGKLKELWPPARVTALRAEGAWGAAERARALFEQDTRTSTDSESDTRSSRSIRASIGNITARAEDSLALDAKDLSQTENRNPRSMNLDRLSPREAIHLMIQEEARIPRALFREAGSIERAVQMIVSALKKKGRLFYVGAGTSGRLGILDASECPPTFRTPLEQVQGIIAGGHEALWKSIEGAEDNPRAGAGAIGFRGTNRKDVVVGIAASGRTPFVWGALEEAKRRKAKTILICFNPRLAIPSTRKPDLVIAPNVGPEILTGSTRLKAGTATKQILNMLTTLSMVRLGKVVQNLMIDLNPSNSKLRARAVRIVKDLAGCDSTIALRALKRSNWIIKSALRRIKNSGRG